MHLFYAPDIDNNTLYTLNEEESKHCARVLRLKINDEVILVDGRGGYYKGFISDDNYKRCTVTIDEKKENYGKRNQYLHIAIAPTKNIERTEWFIEKATEIGIDEISLISCSNSERQIVKTERLEKVIVSAMKQSVKAYKPILNELISFKNFISKDYSSSKKCIAHCYDMPKELLKNIYSKDLRTLILIGPEGDFTKDEVELANKYSFQSVSLGESRLRTETAALLACATINILG
jgi:16S rRNA (uracil1498-N3)-methyltransferase